MSNLNINAKINLAELNGLTFTNLSAKTAKQENLSGNLPAKSQINEMITGLAITNEAGKSRILNSNPAFLAASPTPLPSRVNHYRYDQSILNGKASFQTLNTDQQKRVTTDLQRFSKTDSFQNASPADRKILLSHIGDALIYREQLRNTGNSNNFAAKSALNEVNFSLNQVVSGKLKVRLEDLDTGIKAQYNPNTKTISLGRNAIQSDIIGDSVSASDAAQIGSSGNFASDIAHEARHAYNDISLKRNIQPNVSSDNNFAAGFLDEFSAQIAGYRSLGIRNNGNLTKEIIEKLVYSSKDSSANNAKKTWNNLYTSNGNFRRVIDQMWRSGKTYTAEQVRQNLVNAGFNTPFINRSRND